MLIRVCDFETTGTKPTDAVVQIGQCDIRCSNGAVTIGMPSAMLVNPGRPIPPAASAIHHLRDRHVTGAPSVDVGQVQLMAGPPDLFCAHNAAFDRMFFGGGDQPWICTLKAGRRLWPDADAHSNQALRYHLGVDDIDGFDVDMAMPPHHARSDVYVTAWVLAQALKRADIAQMIEWSNQPSLLPGAINFGKHKGTPWPQVDSGYLEWICFKATDMDADKKFTAKYWLDRRLSDNR